MATSGSSITSRIILLLFLSSLSLSLLASAAISTPSKIKITPHDDKNKHPTIPHASTSFRSGMSMLELSTRPWLYTLSQKYGRNISRLADIPDDEFRAIANENFDMVWMMGVWQLGPYGLHHDQTDPSLLASYSQVLPDYTMADIIGSPYAVTTYTCNTQLKLNSMGLKLMLDFVPNHTAVDCPWNSDNGTTLNYYIRAPKSTTPPYDPARFLPNGVAYGSCGQGCYWTDTAQLNYWNPQTAAVRTQQLLRIASMADGIRCDMAYLLLNDLFQQNWNDELGSWGWNRPNSEWWSDAISAVKAKYPNVIFLAEVYDPFQSKLQQCGFDYTYDKTLHDKLGNGNLDDIRNWITSNSQSFTQHSAHFLSNHDEQRAVAFFGSWWRADAAALLTYTLPGMRFFWMGQQQGFANKLDVHLRREKSEPVNSNTVNFYNTLYTIVNTDVFNKGQWSYLPVTDSDSDWRLISYSWEYNGEKRLCVINYSDQQGSGNIVVPNAQAVNGNDTIPLTDLLSGSVYYRSASQMRTQGLTVVVNSWYAQIFQY